MTRFFLRVVGLLMLGETASKAPVGSGDASSVGEIGPDIDLCALAAYPELSEFMVLDLLMVGSSAI